MSEVKQMIESNQIIQLLIETYPDFRKALIESVDHWLPEKGPIRPHSILMYLSGPVVKNFLKGNYDNAEQLFDLIERMVVEGEPDLANAATTCFLENLQNIASHTDNDFEGGHFVPLLGENSKEFCIQYDEMTGAKTKELYK
jgi:hypothetical protein